MSIATVALFRGDRGKSVECFADHMTPSRDRTLHRGREDVAREEDESVAVAVRTFGPLVAQIVEHGCPLSDVYRFRGLWVELERLHAIDIVEVEDRESSHIAEHF